jgi:hypothetical protein
MVACKRRRQPFIVKMCKALIMPKKLIDNIQLVIIFTASGL